MTTTTLHDDVSAAPFVLRDDADGVATLTLNRPAQFNALSTELLAELQTALDAIGAPEGAPFLTCPFLKKLSSSSAILRQSLL